MTLHAICVFGKVYKLSPEKILRFESTIKCFKENNNRQVTGFTTLISPHRLLC